MDKQPCLIDGEVLKARIIEISNDGSIDDGVKLFILLGEIQSGRFNVVFTLPQAIVSTESTKQSEAV